MFTIRDTSGNATFTVKIHRRAKRNAITGDGKANAACIEFFANLLKVPRSSVTIASGQTRSQESDSCGWVVGRGAEEEVEYALNASRKQLRIVIPSEARDLQFTGIRRNCRRFGS
jgi:hypothetical protein